MSDIGPSEYAGLLLPGGPGVKAQTGNEELLHTIRAFVTAKNLVFAICAAPLLLDRAGVLRGRKFTCYPGTAGEIRSGTRLDEKVVVDGKIVTSQGVGTSLDAAIRLVEIIVSKSEALDQAGKALYRPDQDGRQ